MKIRNATTKDATQLQILLKQLGYNLTLEQVHQKIEIYNKKDGHFVFVAELDIEVVGFISFICYECFVVSGGCVHIESIVIDASHRGKGIGQKLMGMAEELALKQGCNIAELITFNYRSANGTHAFYEKLEYQDQIKTDISYFSKEISPS